MARTAAEELELACACARGEERAIAAFDAEYLAPIARSIARGDSAALDDLRQVLRERLLVAGEGRSSPRIADYTGRGPLAAWVRVTAVRAAINLREAQRPAEPLERAETLELLAAAPDPALTLLRVQCRDEFREAFALALAALEPRERNVLRFHFLQGLTGDLVAEMYGVSRRTVHRWLEEARSRLLAATREHLAQRIVVAPQELESIMQALQSELGSTLARHIDDR